MKAMASYQETMQLFLTGTVDGFQMSQSTRNLSSYTLETGLWISDTGQENLQWFLNSVFQVAYPVVVNEQLWSCLLYDLLMKLSDDSQGTGIEFFVSELLKRCSVETARSVLWSLFDHHESRLARIINLRKRPAFTSPRIFQKLIEKTGGVDYLRTPVHRRKGPQSFISHVIESYPQWHLFLQAINQSKFEVSEVIRGDLDLYQCGWTEEGA